MITRRGFLSTMAAAAGSLLCGPIEAALRHENKPSDVTLQIGAVRVDVAPGRTITTTGYNDSAPGPLIRLKEGREVAVEIFNATDTPEYVHWHGFSVPAELDGTQEENSLVVPARGHLRYRMTPTMSGSRLVHSHAMAMDDFTRGVYSGQFAFVYVEPKDDPGHYDQEVFLTTHEWEPHFTEPDEESGMAQQAEYMGETDWGPNTVEVAYGIRSINGKALGHAQPIRVKQGQRVMFRILNASATENVQLSLPGHEFIVIALDGNVVPRPQRVGMLELGCAERVDAVVEMNNPGVWILGSTDDSVRGLGLGILIEYAGHKETAMRTKESGQRWDYRDFGDNKPLPEPDETMPMVIDRVVEEASAFERWTINGKGYDERDEHKVLRKGRRHRLVFDNRTADAHPLHLHREIFELASIDGRPTSGVKKDTVLVKGFQTVEVDVAPNERGLTLFHCHQQLHMDHGFKSLFRIT